MNPSQLFTMQEEEIICGVCCMVQVQVWLFDMIGKYDNLKKNKTSIAHQYILNIDIYIHIILN